MDSPHGILTKMVSSPIHSILSHAMRNSSHFPQFQILRCSTNSNAVIRPSFKSNSKSSAKPRRMPSHRLMISFSRNCAVLQRFIRSPPFHTIYVMEGVKNPFSTTASELIDTDYRMNQNNTQRRHQQQISVRCTNRLQSDLNLSICQPNEE